ncbi:MAG: glycosyltransferase [Calditrichaeota bacterium]|nr:glycosyltransferase [Calditrichota bacterium]
MGNGSLGRLSWVNRRLPARLKEIGADLLFSFANIAPVRSGLPQVVFCHQRNAFFSDGIPSRVLFKRWRMRFMRSHILRGARASGAMIVQTKAMRERIIELEPSLDGRIHVIPSGYRYPSVEPNIRVEKKALIDGADRPRLIYISHPSEHKNHLALVRAMPGILKTIPSASLLLTLDKQRPGHRRYTSFIVDIQKEAEQLGVSQRLVWLGILNPDEVEYALRVSDLTVFPSLAESFGMGLAESMAAECPVAAADLSYAHDVCGEAAIYFDPRDSADIAETVLSMLRDQAISERLRSLGTERKDRFSYERIAGEIALVLEMAAELYHHNEIMT